MAYRLALESSSSQPLIPVAGGLRALAPHDANSVLGLPAAKAEVDQNPYLSTPAPQFTEAIISIADLIGYMRRFGLLGFLTALPLAAFAFYFLGMGAKLYEAEAKLRLRIGENNVLNLPDSSRGGPGELSAPQLVNNHLTEMKSRRFAEFLFDKFDTSTRESWLASLLANPGRKAEILKLFGLYKPGPPPPAKDYFIEQIIGTVNVEPLKESHILRVIVRDGEPQMAADIANVFAEQYIRFNGAVESGVTKGEKEYLEKQASELRARLEESERRLAEYRKSAGILETTAGSGVDSARMLQFNTAITDAQQRLIKARSDLQSIRITQQAGRDLQEVRLVGENGDVAFHSKELDAKITERRAMEPLCGRRHPKMIALSGEIDSLHTALKRAIDAVVTRAETEVSTLEQQIQDYEKQLSTSRTMAVDQSSKNVEYNLLSDRVAADRLSYQKIVSSLSNAEIAGGYTESSALSLADTASAPGKPVKPNKPMAAVASLMLFGILFLGVPIGWGLIDQHVLKIIRQGGSPSPNIPSAREVAHVPIPTAAQPVPQRPASSPFQLAAPPPPSAPLSIPGLGSAPVLAHLPRVGPSQPEQMLSQLLQPEPAGAAGALQQITITLEMQALKRSGLGGIILITSADAGEGKTAAAAALAAAFCHQGRSVFMMECNAVSPALHHWFPHASHHSSWAHDLESLRYGNTHLFLLPAHDLPAYATNELLDGYRAWIDRARQHVDWIILDAGPVLRNFADVAPLAPLATDVLLVNNPAVVGPAKLRATLSLLQPMMSRSAFRGLIIQDS
jgi:uncharacterized protein involved in exopolysaccharide biosynthesis/Mrp family chromosome partitioning ATPase